MTVPDGPLNMDHWRDESGAIRRKRDWWWKVLWACREECSAAGGDKLNDWMKETYGVEICYDSGGGILGNYNVTDEKKHLVFLLKFH